MKKLFLFFLLLQPIVAIANAVEIDGIYYNLGYKTAEVTKSSGKNYFGVLIIPSEVIYNKVTYSVTTIGKEAFSGCNNLTSLTLPNTVTSIGDEAFLDCDKLSSIIFSENVTHIGSGAIPSAWYNKQPDGYIYIGKVLYKYKGKMAANTIVEIKDGTTEISDRAFLGCSNMISVTIPKSVSYIGIYAFDGCTNLTAVNISDLAAWCSIKHYNSGDYSSDEDNHYPMSNPLYYAKHLYLNGEEVTELAIPKGVTSIGRYAFVRCTNIKSVIIPEGVEYIDEYAFEDCTGLVSVTIPKSVTSINHAAFSDCTGLTSVHISDLSAWCNIGFGLSPLYSMYGQSNPLSNAHHLFLNGKEVKDLIIPDDIDTINSYAFHNCYSFNSVTIPSSVTTIGKYAFYGCWSLIDVSLPSSITSVGVNAFAETEWFVHYKGLMYLGSVAYKYIGDMPENTDIVIREGTTEISNEAFKTCNNLRSITIPNSVTKIGNYAFSGSGLTSLTIGSGVSEIGFYAFEDCNVNTINISDLDAWCKIKYGYQGNIGGPYRLYLNGEEVTEINIPEGINYLGGICSGCISLKAVNIPNSVMSISNSAFSGCSSLTSVNIPNSVTSIGSFVFEGCSNLTSVYIPNSVTSIGEFAFSGCSSLKSMIIPNGVSYIMGATFQGCINLTMIIIPNTVKSIGEYNQEIKGVTNVEIIPVSA